MPTIVPPARIGFLFDGYWNTLRNGGVKYYNSDDKRDKGKSYFVDRYIMNFTGTT